MLIVDIVENTEKLNEEDKAISRHHLKVVARTSGLNHSWSSTCSVFSESCTQWTRQTTWCLIVYLPIHYPKVSAEPSGRNHLVVL